MLLKTYILMALLVASWVAPGHAAEAFDHSGLARRALDQHIRPGYARFADAASAMVGALPTSCTDFGRTERDRAQRAFLTLVSAWGRIEHIQFGPVMVDRRLERILFWPDRRNLGLRQVQKIVRTRDDTALDREQLAQKSVAVQGLGALEDVLYGDSAPPPESSFICRYAAAIAHNVAHIARDLVAGWADGAAYAEAWTSAGAGNTTFLSARETTAVLAKAFTNGLERVRDQRVAEPLGYGKTRRPMPVLFEKSGQPIRILTANVDGLVDLFVTGGIRDAILATNTKNEHVNIAANLDMTIRELRTASAAFAAVAKSPKPFASADTRQRLVAVGFPLKNANIQASALLALTAGVTLGFNSSDGD